MHIPDGYLSLPVAAATALVAFCVAVLAVRRASGSGGFTGERVSLLTALSAGIFVAQMIAWPIPGGTSLHLIGGALAGVLLGPWLGVLSMALVLFIQCLVFHDGGITALGANVLNMGVVAVISGYLVFRALRRRAGPLVAGVAGGWVSLVLAGVACGAELGLSWGSALPLYIMTSWHAVLGVVEGIITGLVIRYLSVKSPGVVV